MKVVATNIGQKKELIWHGQQITTGIFKYPMPSGVYLEAEDVQSDAVVDRQYHGGIDKACYAYSADFYDHWKTEFPHLDWDYGMFGENLTIEGLDERKVSIGDIFTVGEAIIQVSEPRQPCMKLNVRMDSNMAVKKFTQFGHSGVYFRVLQPGKVTPGDTLVLKKKGYPELFVHDVFRLIYQKGDDPLRAIARAHPDLADSTRSIM